MKCGCATVFCLHLMENAFYKVVFLCMLSVLKWLTGCWGCLFCWLLWWSVLFLVDLFLQHLTLTTFLPNVFSDYLTEKICTIRNNFPPRTQLLALIPLAGNPLLTFESVTDEFVLKIINSASAKSCELDPIPTRFFMKTLTSSCRPSRTSSTHLLPLALYHMIWRQPSSNLCWKSHHLTKIFWKTTIPFLTFHFCPKFSTNFSPISKKTTSAIPFSQPIEQDTALRPFCYVL